MKTSKIELSNLDILRSLQALERVNSDGVEFNAAYTMALNLKTLRKASEDYQEYRAELIKGYCELDERGNPVPDTDNNKYVFRSDDDEVAANEAVEELNKSTVELNLYTYPPSMFAKAKIPHTLIEHLTWMIREKADD